MSYELRKILRSRYLAVLLLLAVAANGVLFYLRCTEDLGGYTWVDMAAEYEAIDTLETEYHELSVLLFSDMEADVPEELLNRWRLLKQVSARIEEAQGYGEYLQDLQAETRAKLNSGLFSTEAFPGKSLQKGLQEYSRLEGLELPVAFSGGVEVFLGWNLTDIFFLLFGITAGLLLMTAERRSGLTALLRPTKGGHAGLYMQKFAAMGFLLLLGFGLLYGANILISAITLGLGDLSRPIQSVNGMQSCPVPLTVLGWLFSFFGEKLLWGLAASALFFLLCCCTDRVELVLLLAAAISGLSVLLHNSSSLWLRSLSLSRMALTEESYLGCFYLNFFGIPLRQLLVRLLVAAGIFLLSAFGGLMIFCCTQAVATARPRGILPLPHVTHHTNLFLHEGHKVLFTNGALLILALFLMLQVGLYGNAKAYYGEDEWYYRSYSQRLGGLPSEEKTAFLCQEEARFADLYSQLEDYSQEARGDDMLFQSLAEDVLVKLRKEEAFRRARLQYESLREGQEYVYETGYQVLFGVYGIRQDLLDLAKLFFALVLAFSGVFALEKESGVELLQIAAGKERAIGNRKRLWAFAAVLIALSIAFLPRCLNVASSYGLPQLKAQANSLPIFASFPDAWDIWHIFVLQNLVRLILSTAAAALLLFLSKKTGSTLSSLLMGLGILVIPVLVALLIMG